MAENFAVQSVGFASGDSFFSAGILKRGCQIGRNGRPRQIGSGTSDSHGSRHLMALYVLVSTDPTPDPEKWGHERTYPLGLTAADLVF